MSECQALLPSSRGGSRWLRLAWINANFALLCALPPLSDFTYERGTAHVSDSSSIVTLNGVGVSHAELAKACVCTRWMCMTSTLFGKLPNTLPREVLCRLPLNVAIWCARVCFAEHEERQVDHGPAAYQLPCACTHH